MNAVLTGSGREKEFEFERRADAGRLEVETAIMGMDVRGKAPTAPEGEYFRRNTLNWAPLVDCVMALCPEETAPRRGWNYNNGDGLDTDGAAASPRNLRRTGTAAMSRATARPATLGRTKRLTAGQGSVQRKAWLRLRKTTLPPSPPPLAWTMRWLCRLAASARARSTSSSRS